MSLLDTNFDIDLNEIQINRINRIIELDYSRITANNCYNNTSVKNWKFINYKPNKNIETYVLCRKTILKDDKIIIAYRFINANNYYRNKDWSIIYFRQKYPRCELPLFYNVFKEMEYKIIDNYFLQILGD